MMLGNLCEYPFNRRALVRIHAWDRALDVNALRPSPQRTFKNRISQLFAIFDNGGATKLS